MDFNHLDISIIIAYFLITFTLGLIMSNRAQKGLTEYFLSGRSAPWWLAGTGMVATTFGADTPLWVAGVVGASGIAGNWFWWCAAAGGMLTVFLFARLWRRSGVMTDLELIDIRYSGDLRHFLRGFKALYFGLIMNTLIIGWVNLAMLKILTVVFPEYDPRIILSICAAGTVLYVAVSGLWGVAVADVFQFCIAMGGCIALAVMSMSHESILQKLPPESFNFFPTFGDSKSGAAGLELPLLTFFTYVGIQWWAAWYPGAEPGGGGYVAQRIMSAKDEKSGMLATLWFVVAHYCVRSWPWIIAALAAAALYPSLAGGDKESGYVFLMADVLPSPVRGLLVAAFMGAYMSTISTQLNWGSSYLINDFLKKYVLKGKTDAYYIGFTRILLVILMAFALLLTFTVLESVKQAWTLMIEVGAGTGFVLILRWYWWRLSAVSELVSIASSIVVVVILKLVLAPYFKESMPELLYLTKFPFSFLIIVGFNILCTLVATYMSAPTDAKVLGDFYKRTTPAGPGWATVRKSLGVDAPVQTESLGWKLLGWVAGTALVYTLLFALGSLFFGRITNGILLGLAAIICSVVIWYIIKRDFAGSRGSE